jgi:hypothetical protein
VVSYLTGLADRYPGLVRLEQLEQTQENRAILAIRIGNSKLGNSRSLVIIVSWKIEKTDVVFRTLCNACVQLYCIHSNKYTILKATDDFIVNNEVQKSIHPIEWKVLYFSFYGMNAFLHFIINNEIMDCFWDSVYDVIAN